VAGSSLLVLLDDIATILDDVSVMSKVAAKKTAGVLGDDLAVNAEKVTGVRAHRELPVVWAVAVGSLRNKVILVPAAMVLATVAPWAIAPLLVCGGLFLCYEGGEKLWHAVAASRESKEQAQRELVERLADPAADPRQVERDKIRGAIRTDFILSAEIIVITLGIVADKVLATQVGVLTAIALIMTVGVYGLVAAIVKLDDAGLYLAERDSASLQRLGRGLLAFAPWLMRTLGVVGTAAMFMVGGGILLHSAHAIEHAVVEAAARLGPVGELLGPLLAGALLGVVAGFLVLAVVSAGQRLIGRKSD
jgi:predicted DNA repair protein MutK